MKWFGRAIVLIFGGLFFLAIGFVIGQCTSDQRWERESAINAAIEISGLTPALARLHDGKIAEGRDLLNVEIDRNLGILRKYQYRVDDPEEIKRHNFFLSYLSKVWRQHPPFAAKDYAEIPDWKEIRDSNDSFLKRSAEAHQLERKERSKSGAGVN